MANIHCERGGAYKHVYTHKKYVQDKFNVAYMHHIGERGTEFEAAGQSDEFRSASCS
jgi:hypothetical protein